MFAAPLSLALALLAPAAGGKEDLRSLEAADAVHVYSGEGERALELSQFNPPDLAADERRPAVLFFHGGGWVKGDPASLAPQCRYFASRGLVCFTARYRLADRQPEADGTKETVRDSVADARAALRFVVEHAAELHVDPAKIVTAGGSAGGHLAIMAALPPDAAASGERPPVAACVLFNPVTVLTERPSLPEPVLANIRERSELFGGSAEPVDPLSNVGQNGPPMLLMFGTEDRLLPSARLFCKTYEAAGNRCELEVWEGEDHSFFHLGRNRNRNFVETCARADEFLESLGLLSGPPTIEAFMAAHGVNPSPTSDAAGR